MKTRTAKTSRISRSFIAHLSRSLALSTLAAFGIGQANAANFDWDPLISVGATLGGAGTWDTTLLNWYDGAGNVAWPNLLTDTAVFGGTTGGLVTINNAGLGVNAGGLTFNTTGYTIAGNVPADVLTLGALPVTVTNAAHTATINAIVAGAAGLNKAGAGTLVLGGVNTFTGGVSVTGGTLSVAADTGLGAVANGVTIDGGALQATATFTSARAVTLGASGGTLDVGTGANLTLSTALVANANALTKIGAGTLTLGAASTRTGTSLISGGTLVANNVGALGTGDVTVNSGGILQNAHNLAAQNWATNVTLDNGSFIHNPGANHVLNFAAGKALTIGAGGGTVEVSPGAQAASKVFLAAGQLAGGGVLTKTGLGVLQLAGANTGFTGAAVINGGTIEFQNVDSLGTAATSITVGAGGDIATSGVANRNTINLLTGGTISANNAAANYTGTVNVAGNATAALRLFQTPATPSSFTISGGLSGPANLTATAPAAATLTLSGNNTGFSGAIGTTANATVAIVGKQALGTGGFILNGGNVRVEASDNTGFTAGVAGLNATYYNFGANAGTTVRNETRFASQLLALDNGRTATFVDANINIPNSGSGFQPTTWHPGFHVSAGNTQEGVAFSGSINITTAGAYTFTSASDDGSLLYINGVQVVSNDGGHGTPGPTPNGTITLAAGQHSIFLRVANGGGGGAVQLSYNGPDTGATTVLVPNSVLSTATATGAVAIGPVITLDAVAATTSGLEIFANSSADSLALGANQTLRLDSPTISSLNVTGATTLTGAGTIQSTSVKLMLDGPVGEVTPGTGLTIAGPNGALGAIQGNGYIVQFNAANTYTGTTTVTGSQLQLNAAGTSVAGNLTVNALNLDGPMKNVILQQADQIADTATLDVQRGIFDVGANSDTVGTLTVSGGRIMGSGVITPTTALNLTGGIIEAGIGGSLGLTKAGNGTVTLSGNSTYTGQTVINAGALRIGSSNGLGASGAGNDTVVNAGAQLQIQGGSAIGDDISITGTGIAGSGALRNITGANSITPAVTLAAASTIESNAGNLNLVGGVATGGSALTVQGSGEITITGAVTGGGGITKTGNGTLTFNQNMSSLAGVTHTAGALGFNGTQSFGASTVGSGLAYKFHSDPGAGVDVTAAAGGAVIAGYAADQTLLSRVNTASAGALALGANSSNNLDLSAYATLGLGASGLATYSGTITPNAAGYRFSGAPASGLTPNVLRLTNGLTGANPLTVTGGALDLTGLNSTQTGAISVTGGTLRIQSNAELGAVANTVNLNGGTLEYAANSPANGNLWFQLGNVLGGGQRTVNIGAAGGTISVSSFGYGNTLLGLSGVNPLTGSGTLTKTGFGHLFLNDASTFSGNIVVAAQSANFEMRSKGSIPNVASVEVNQSSNFVVDNQNGWGQRQFSNPTNDQNRVNDAATITLKGGNLFYRSRNAAGQIVETFGTVANPEGQNLIQIEKSGTVGGEILITNLTRPVGGGTVRFQKNGGTFGTTGDNARIFLTNVNGAAPGVVNQLGGWAYNSTDFQFVGYGANGIVNSTNTDQGAAAFTPVAANLYNLNVAATATLADAAGNVHSMAALRFGNNAAQTLAFADGANDVLFIGTGGILNDNSNQARTIGSAAQRGKITAGTSTAPAGAKELFFHGNQNNTNVESIIVDNNGAVTVVKDLGGTLNLNAANTYTGGTNLFGGRINVAVAGGLGSGAVTVKGAALQLNQPGATTAASGVITGKDGSEIYIQNATGLYNTAGDRFVIEGGSGLTGNSQNAGQNLATLTRIDVGAPFTAGGQVKLSPNAVIRTVTAFDGDVMTNMIGNLGTSADLYFNQTGGGGANQFITVGQGTPWKGLSSGVGNSGWTQGTINATSDFYLQGLTRVGANVVLTLSNGAAAGSYAINNIAGKPINAFVEGQVLMNEDSPVTMSGDITFVVGAGGYLQPNFSNSFGSQAGNLNAKLVVQAGGTIDPGNFVTVGVAGNQPQGFAYPAPSPVNTNATFEAGGRFLLNDVSGIGSTTGGATFTMKANSILELGTAQTFLGSAAGGLVNTGQFVYEPGAIVRLSGDRIFKQDVFVNGEPNGKQTVLEIYGGNRTMTDAVDPRVVIAPGSPTVVPMTLTYGNGGMITNDSTDRSINERRGGLVLENGTVLAATSQTFFNIQEDVSVPAGATLNVGSTKYVDGNPKFGLVQFTGPQSNVFGAGAKLVVLDGSAFGFNATNTFPDTTPIELPAAVTNVAPVGSIGFNPGNGSTLLPNVGNFAEIVGHVTGDGSVIANAGGTYLGINATSNFTSNIRFRSANGQQANLWKVGSNDLTLTGSSDSTGVVAVGNGKLILSGTGNTAFGENRPQKGGTLVLDNTATALSNRLGGTAVPFTKNVTPMGGTLELIGNATTAVEERFSNLFNSASGFGPFAGVTGLTTVKITPGAASTTVLVNSAENFQSAGIGQQRNGTWVLNTPTAANAPMTYLPAGGIAGGIVPGAAANANGLVQIASPNFNAIATFGVQSGGSYGSAGTSVAATRPDYLGDANGDGVPEGFMTQDGIFLNVTNTNGTAVLTGLGTTTGLLPGMLVQGSVPNGTRILSVDSATQVTLTANTTAAAANMQFITGGMRNLAASEYASYFRDNQNVGLNVKLSGTSSTSGDTRVQTLTMTPGSTLNITGALPYTESLGRLHLNGSGVFVQAGAASTINGGTSGGARNYLQVNGGTALFLHTQGDLNLNAMVFTDQGVVKTGPGTVNVGAEAFGGLRGSIQIDAGTVNLGAGNSMSSIRQANGSVSNQHFYLNGGTLNLNGNSQMVNTLSNNNELPGMGGTVTSATPATLTLTGGGRFSGSITGAISIDKTANNTQLLTGVNSFTGSTLVRAGTLSLRDSAVLSGTSGVTVNHATLQLDNSYLSNIADRIPAATPVSLYGATLNITGAAGQVASQTFNNLTLAGGLTTFNSNAGGGGANEINIGNLIRPAGSGAMINFTGGYGFQGTAGNTTTAIRNFITNVNGSPLALNDGIIGGWAVINGDHFATYRPATGVGALTNTEDGFAGYESGDSTTALATQNVNEGAARTFTASKTINSWRMVPGAAITNTYNDGVGLTIDSGGLLGNSNFTVSHNAAANARNNFITSNSGELNYFVNQNTHGINIPVVGNIDLVKSGNGALNLNASALLTATAIVGNTISLANTAGLEVGDPISGGTTSTYPAGTVITAITPGVSITTNNPVTAVGATLDVRNTFGNTYTGKTIVNGGTLTLNQSGASQTALAIPGDLVITNGATVTEANVVGQFKNNANITLVGGARINFLNAANVTETIGSLTFLDGVSAAGTSNVDRTALQFNSVINLSSPTAITATNTNPSGSGMPFIGGFAGTVGFTNAGGSTLDINSPTAVNGVLATGLTIGARIGSVPTGVAEGGLIKAGNGLLTLRPDQNPAYGATVTTTVGSNVVTGLVGAITGATPLRVGQMITSSVANAIPANSYIVSIDSDTQIKISQNAGVASGANTLSGLVVNQFGNPATLTDVFNIQSGTVRADTSGALGSNFANTTVQSGAVLLAANNGSQVITGSITLKNGSTLGATIQSFIHGAATLTPANQSVLNVPSGNVHVAAYDYYVPSTNGGNITFNGRLTGAGNINIYGPQITQGNGGGGAITLGNPILTGTGSNDYAGTISVGPNSILANQVALIAGSGITRTTGNAIGTATINLDGGRLRLRDDASLTAEVSNATLTYGTNVTLSRNSWIDANRQTSTTAVNNIINLGTLTVAAGSKVLNVDSGNGYQIGITSLDGPGTFIKAGAGRLNINGIAPTFSGNIGIAGPVGIVVGPTFNTTTVQNLVLPTTATLNNFDVNGLYITEAAKTVNVNGVFSVNANPGTGANNMANVAGRVAITNTTTLNANAIVNNGVIGPVGGAVTLTSPAGFSGSGTYLTTSATAGVTSSNPLTLAGNVTAGVLRTAGLNTVTVTGSAHTPTGVEVQGGTLKLAPTAGVASSGTIKVFGVPASVASPTTTPVSAVTGTLDFAPATTATHTGNITNSGVVKVSSGTTTVTGIIAGSATTQFVPGLLEGLVTGTTGFTVDGTRPANPGNFGVQMEPRMLQNSSVTQQALTGHLDNDVWVYNGYVKDDDGVFSFAGNQDDNLGVWIDGALVLNSGGNVVGSTAHKMTQNGVGVTTPNGNGGTPSQNFGAGIAIPGYGTGWHLVEIRMRNGTGGAGPWANNGFTGNYGFGYKNGIGALDGADYIKPIEDGTGSLFLTALGGKGDINLADGTTLNAGGFQATKNVTLNSIGNTVNLNVTAAGASDAESISLTGTTASAIVTLGANAAVTTGNLSVVAAGALSLAGDPGSSLTVTTSQLLDGPVTVASGTLNIQGVGTGSGQVNLEDGVLNLTGSITGSVTVNGGILTGNSVSPTTGQILGITDLFGGTVKPGAATGTASSLMHFDGGLNFSGGAVAFDLNGTTAGTGYDQLSVIGSVTIGGSTPFTLSLGFLPAPNTSFVLVDNDAADAVAGTFKFSYLGTPLNEGDNFFVGANEFEISYIGGSGNDITTTFIVPEPGSAALLLGGLAMLAGRRRRKQA